MRFYSKVSKDVCEFHGHLWSFRVQISKSELEFKESQTGNHRLVIPQYQVIFRYEFVYKGLNPENDQRDVDTFII